MANATGTEQERDTTPAGVTAQLAGMANERGARLMLAARDARTIAGMLDNHGRPESAQFLRRSGDRGERLARYLTQTEEADVRRAAAYAAAVAAGLVVVRRIRSA